MYFFKMETQNLYIEEIFRMYLFHKVTFYQIIFANMYLTNLAFT